jgi:hypothetical protein
MTDQVKQSISQIREAVESLPITPFERGRILGFAEGASNFDPFANGADEGGTA